MMVKDLGDGNINHVFQVAGEQRSLIFKQALPFARVVGPEMPLPVERVGVEAKVLKEYARLLPGSVPEVYLLDEEKWIAVIEDLSAFQVGRTALIQGTESARFAKDIGRLSHRRPFTHRTFIWTRSVVFFRPVERTAGGRNRLD